MKRWRGPILLIALSLTTAATVRILRDWPVHAEASLKEFTLIRAEESRSPAVLHRRMLIARRADGARAEGELPAEGEMIPSRRLVYLIREGVRAEVNDLVRAKTTYYIGNATALPQVTPDPQCGFSRLSPQARPVYKGEGEVRGVKTVIIQTGQRAGNDTYLRSEWRAPEFDCVVLQVSEERRDESGTITGRFEIEPAKLTPGPPDPRLFDIPADYKELAPSEMRAAVLAGAGRPPSVCTDSMRRRLEREDREYRKNRAAGQ